MLQTVTRTFYFDSAHHLEQHLGKCHNPHGHTYKLAVEVTRTHQVSSGSPTCLQQDGPSEGMLVDFGDLKKLVTENVIDKVDHRNLDLDYENTTCELLVRSFAKQLEAPLRDAGLRLVSITLWETTNPTENSSTLYMDVA